MNESRATLSVFILAVVVFSITASAEEPFLAPFKIAFHREGDRADVKSDHGIAVLSIHSASGIGKATVSRTGQTWPKEVKVRLHLKGLEHFRASNGKAVVSAAVASTDPKQVRQSRGVGDGETSIDEKSEEWMKVRILDADGKPTDALPGEGGCFEIELPRSLFDGDPASIELEWIDFYRG